MQDEKTFVFNCPVCGKPVEAPVSVVGMQAECPECDSQITIPHRPENTAVPKPLRRPVQDSLLPTVAADTTLSTKEKSTTMKIELPDLPDMFPPTQKRKITFKRRKR